MRLEILLLSRLYHRWILVFCFTNSLLDTIFSKIMYEIVSIVDGSRRPTKQVRVRGIAFTTLLLRLFLGLSKHTGIIIIKWILLQINIY